MLEQKKKFEIQFLERYFEKEPQVLLAFLFGSRITGLNRESSDWDIGIYLRGKYDLEIIDRIWSEAGNILKKETDLIVLNDAPPLLASRIIREGFPLVIKDRVLFLEFLLRITEEAEFFLEFSHDYYEIYQRSSSLSETDKARLERIIIFLESEMADFVKFEKMSLKEYQKETSRRREVERWIENLINSVIDISKIILASEKKPLPDTYQKIILELGAIPKFDNEVCERISRWIVLRNILAHEYLDIRWKSIYDFLNNAMPYLQKFLQQVKNFLSR